MPRRRKGNRRRGNGGRNSASITKIRFHHINSTTVSGVTGNSTFTVSPRTTQLGALSNAGESFDLFRFSRMRYRLHPMDPTNGDTQAICYVPDIDVQAVTVPSLSDSPLATFTTPFSGVPSRWVNVPPSQLKGMLDWYKCQADAGAAEFESQGILIVSAGLSDSVIWEIEGICEFKNPVSDTVLFERTIQRAVDAGRVIRITPNPTSQKEVEETPHAEQPLCIAQRRSVRTMQTFR